MKHLLISVLMVSASQGSMAGNVEHESEALMSTGKQSVLGYYVDRMARKIWINMNRASCKTPGAEMVLAIKLTDTGDMSESPTIVLSSGDARCDESALKAILKAKPFDLPHDNPSELKKMLEQIDIRITPRAAFE